MTMQMKKLALSPSRSGRHLQRYNLGFRQVVGCIPYRIKVDRSSSPEFDGVLIENLEVLLISSQKSSNMMFPKGGWELDEDIKLAAARETLEEAGVIGLLGDKLGEWIFKSQRQEKYHEASMFALLVTEELDIWPEKDVRWRIWMTVDEAREACAHLWMKEALEAFVCGFMKSGERAEDEPMQSCRFKLHEGEELRRSIGRESSDEEADCYLIS